MPIEFIPPFPLYAPSLANRDVTFNFTGIISAASHPDMIAGSAIDKWVSPANVEEWAIGSGDTEGQFWENGSGDGSESLYNTIGEADIKRIGDRLLLGKAADSSTGGTIVPIVDIFEDMGLERYLLRGAQLASIHRYGGIGVLGVSLLSDRYWLNGVKQPLWAAATVYAPGAIVGSSGAFYQTTTGGTSGAGPRPSGTGNSDSGIADWTRIAFSLNAPIGVAGGSASDGNDGNVTWGAYFFGYKHTGGGNVFVDESAIQNFGSSVVTNPYDIFGSGGVTIGKWISSQGDTAASAAITIGDDGSTGGVGFHSGIVVEADGLVGSDGVTPGSLAFFAKLALGQCITWFVPGGAQRGFTINSQVVTGGDRVQIEADDNTIKFQRGSTPISMLEVTNNSGTGVAVVNGISILATATGVSPLIAPIGETNLAVRIRGKGNAGVILQNGSGNTTLTVTGTSGNPSLSFFSAAAVVQQTNVGAALSEGGSETNANIATRINQIRTLLLNYGLAA